MEDVDDKVDALESQRAALLDEKKLLAVLEREAFAEHAKLEEDQLLCVGMHICVVILAWCFVSIGHEL